METSLTIVIPWKDRHELQKTLTSNIAYLAQFDFRYDIIVVNCGGDKALFEQMMASVPGRDHIRTIFIDRENFHKTYSLNAAISTISSKYYMCLDTDIILQAVNFPELFSNIDKGCFVTMKEVWEEKEEWYEMAEFPDYIDGIVARRNMILFELKDGREIFLKLERQNMINNKRTGPGIILAAMEDIRKAGGYNSELTGWGWEDLDMVFRLQVAGLQRLEDGTVLHLSHDNDTRAIAPGCKSKIENEVENFNKCMINYELGIFKGTLNEDIP